MKAILMHAPGEPQVLGLADVPTPKTAHDTDLLVHLRAAGVNPIDTKLRARGTFYPERMPAILGCDGAGVVEAVGAGANRFKPGDAVFFCNGGIGGHPGTYAEYAVVDARFAAHKPASLDFNQAAAGPLVLITAWEALYDRARMTAGQTVLIHAGAGGVGHVAIQLAKAAGCRVLTTVGSASKAAFARQLGADEVISYRETDFVQAVLDLTQGQGADIVFDTVGGVTFIDSFAAARPYGDLVTLLQPDANTDWKTARLRNLRVSQELMLSPMLFGWTEAQQHQAWILEQCAALFDAATLRIHVDRILPLAEAAEAHRLIEAGELTGKVVLAID
jgi:NADPH2:quinone reductase